MDVHYTYQKLLPNIAAPKKYLTQESSTSAIIFYWGMSKQFPQLEVHNILFSEKYEEEFKALSAFKIADDALSLIHI